MSRQERRDGCEDSRIRIVGVPDPRWIEPLAAARAALAAMTDRDETARARVVPDGTDLSVWVALKDGRTAQRRVRTPASLLPTLDALLVVPSLVRESAPPDDATPAGPREAGPGVGVGIGARVGVPDNRSDDIPRRRPDSDKELRVDVGAAVGPRLAGARDQLALSTSGFVQARLGVWILGLGMRWDLFQSIRGTEPPVFEMETIALSITAGRRVRTRFGHLDAGIGPRLISDTQSAQLPAGEVAGSSTDIRPGGFLRAIIGSRSLRLSIEADAEVSPSHLRRDIRIAPSLPALPGWSAALTMGLCWGEP